MRRLIIRPGAIGDLILSLPALEYLRTDYTQVWVAAQNVGLVRFADRVRPISSTGLDLLELGLAPEELPLALTEFDEIVSWYGAGREQFREAVSNLPFRFHPALPDSSVIHATDFYLRQVGAQPGALPRLSVPRWEGGFVAIHPFSGSSSKNWPLERFEELSRRLRAQWCETSQGRRFEDLWDLAQWLAGASAYVGNDSGITHLAAAVGVPVVAIFGPTDPAIWAPRGSNVCVIRKERLEEITMEEVETSVFVAREYW